MKSNISSKERQQLMQRGSSSANLQRKFSKSALPQILRDRLLIEICKGNDEIEQKLKKRLFEEKKKNEDKMVAQRLQIRMRSLFSSKNLSNLTQAPSTFKIPRRDSGLSVVAPNSSRDSSNKRGESSKELEKFDQIQMNKLRVGAKMPSTTVKSSPPLQLFATEQYECLSMTFGKAKDIIIENMDTSPPKDDLDMSNKVTLVMPQVKPVISSRKKQISQLKLSTGEKARLYKRSETIRSMKFIRKLGKKLKEELEQQKEALVKFQKAQKKKQRRQNSQKQVLVESKFKNMQRKHLASSNNLNFEGSKALQTTKSKELINVRIQKTHTINDIKKIQSKSKDQQFEVQDHEMLSLTKKLSEISLSHSSSGVSDYLPTKKLQQNKSQSNSKEFLTTSKKGSSIQKEISKNTTPRLTRGNSNISIEQKSSSNNQILKIDLFKGENTYQQASVSPELEDPQVPVEEEYYVEDTDDSKQSSFQEFSKSEQTDTENQNQGSNSHKTISQVTKKISMTINNAPSANLNDQFYTLKVSKFRQLSNTPVENSRNVVAEIDGRRRQSVNLTPMEGIEISEEQEQRSDNQDAYDSHLMQQQALYNVLKQKQNYSLSSISEEHSSFQGSSTVQAGENSIQSFGRLTRKLSQFPSRLSQNQGFGANTQISINRVQNQDSFKRIKTQDLGGMINHLTMSNPDSPLEPKNRQSFLNQDLSEDSPGSSSSNFVIEEASEHSANSQYSGKPMSQVIFKKLSPSRITSSRYSSSCENKFTQRLKKEQGCQASPLMSSLNESSELADSYDSEAAKMFQLKEVEAKGNDIEELESDSSKSKDNKSNSGSSARKQESDEILRQSSNGMKSESLSSDYDEDDDQQKKIVLSYRKSKELKITCSPMLTRNDIANVDELSDLEEFYLTEIEQQQNQDLIEKMKLQGLIIEEEIREQQQIVNERTKNHFGNIKEELEKLLKLKEKLQRHETKKQMFSFNLYRMRKISDHDLFRDQSADKVKDPDMGLPYNILEGGNTSSSQSRIALHRRSSISSAQGLLCGIKLRQTNSALNVNLKSKLKLDGQKSTKDLGSKSRGSSTSLLYSMAARNNLNFFKDKKSSAEEKLLNTQLRIDEGPSQLSVSSPSQSLSSQTCSAMKKGNEDFSMALEKLKIQAKDSRTNVTELVDGIKSNTGKGVTRNNDQLGLDTQEVQRKRENFRRKESNKSNSFSYIRHESSIKRREETQVQVDRNCDIKGDFDKSIQPEYTPDGDGLSPDEIEINMDLLERLKFRINIDSEEASPCKNDQSASETMINQQRNLNWNHPNTRNQLLIGDNNTIAEYSNEGTTVLNEQQSQILSFNSQIHQQQVQPQHQLSIQIITHNTNSQTVGRRGHQLARQRKQSSIHGDDNSNTRQNRVTTPPLPNLSGAQTSGRQSSDSSTNNQNFNPLRCSQQESIINYSLTNTFSPSNTDSMPLRKSSNQPSPKNPKRMAIEENTPYFQKAQQLNGAVWQQEDYENQVQLVPRQRSLSPHQPKNDAMQRLITLESQNSITKTKITQNSMESRKKKQVLKSSQVFSPKSQTVDVNQALKQVRNNLKELLNDVNCRPNISQPGLLSPSSQKKPPILFSRPSQKKESKSSCMNILEPKYNHTEANERLEKHGSSLKISDQSPRRVTFGYKQKSTSSKKSKSRNMFNQRNYNTANNSMNYSSSNGFNKKKMFSQTHVFGPQNPHYRYSQQNLSPKNHSQISELHQNFMFYNDSTDSLHQKTSVLNYLSSGKISAKNYSMQINSPMSILSGGIRSPAQDIQVVLPIQKKYAPNISRKNHSYYQF